MECYFQQHFLEKEDSHVVAGLQFNLCLY